jgi:hypothetical protein
MTQADSVHSTPPTSTSKTNPAAYSRRRFISHAAGVAAGATAAVVATKAVALPADDSALLKLEEQFFEQHELANAYNDEMERLAAIWTEESRRLYYEALLREAQAGTYLTPEQRWASVSEMPESIEHERLERLQEAHFVKMGALVKEMWATPALTPEGRRAKVLVALRMLPDNWRAGDWEADYGILETRQLLIEFIGGEPGEQLRDQFA